MLVVAFNDTYNIKNSKEPQNKKSQIMESNPLLEVAVYRSHLNEVENTPVEEYLVGVVASEMYVDYELEALKAQAVAARTYIYKQMISDTKENVPEGAIVTDTEMHQVYKNRTELKEQWGTDFNLRIKKIEEAVKSTEGKILTYNNQPIDAAYFSTSNGYTENSEEYWISKLPYLRSVESPWDKTSPKYIESVKISVGEFENKLGVKLKNDTSVGQIISKTTGDRVALVDINGKEFTGREIREHLGLKSSDFEWERKGNQIIITTKGLGHGVGMSQYGANSMAQEGKNFKEIIDYYYKDINISNADKFLTYISAKQ